MRDFFGHLAARALAPEPVVRPRLRGIFEPSDVAIPVGLAPETEPSEVESFRAPSPPPGPSLQPPTAPPATPVSPVGPPPAESPGDEIAPTPLPIESREATSPPVEPRVHAVRAPRPPPAATPAPTRGEPSNPPHSSERPEPGPPDPAPPPSPASPSPSPMPHPERTPELHREPPPPRKPTSPKAIPSVVRIREIETPGVAETPPSAAPMDRDETRHSVKRVVVERRIEPIERRVVDDTAIVVKPTSEPSEAPPAPGLPRPATTPRVEPPRPALRMPLPEPPAAPTIQVTIGRLEVRAAPVDSPARPKPRSAQTVMSLEDYLKQRSGGGR